LNENPHLAQQVLDATQFSNKKNNEDSDDAMMDLLKRSIDLGKEYELWRDDETNDDNIVLLDSNGDHVVSGVWIRLMTKGFLRGIKHHDGRNTPLRWRYTAGWYPGCGWVGVSQSSADVQSHD
jgi:hypothetical protein